VDKHLDNVTRQIHADASENVAIMVYREVTRGVVATYRPAWSALVSDLENELGWVSAND
jgi:hypothetical protein